MKKILVLGVAFALFTVAASAQRGSDAIERHRIERGFDNGQLTRGERFESKRDQARFKHEKRRAFRDHRISPRERKRLAAMKRHQNRKLYYRKHNARRRVF